MLPLGGVSHLDLRVDHVVVSSSDALAGDVARFDEIRDDSLGSPLRDPHGECDLAKAQIAVLRDDEEHLGVVRDERPGLWGLI